MAKKKETKTTAVVVKGNQLITNNDEPVANCDHLLTITPIEDMIITLRGVQVIVDRDLATLYGVETKRMNEQVRRNLNRFPSRFRFQLTQEEVNEVVANCDHLLSIKYSPTRFTASPFADTLLQNDSLFRWHRRTEQEHGDTLLQRKNGEPV